MYYYDDVLTKDQYEYVLNKTLNGNQWNFMGFSNTTAEYKFWYMELSEDKFFTETFLSIVENITNKKFELNRVYANGQTYGLPGNIHQDVRTDYTPELYYTFLYYVNPTWDISWGGSTQIIHTSGQVDTIMPVRNTAIMFNSKLNHLGLEPTRYCPELRVTVAFKLKEII
jgi:Rps23 Pro-64 3,4-dihydroxylase Tpa1-like proline 4-hydroxylase